MKSFEICTSKNSIKVTRRSNLLQVVKWLLTSKSFLLEETSEEDRWFFVFSAVSFTSGFHIIRFEETGSLSALVYISRENQQLKSNSFEICISGSGIRVTINHTLSSVSRDRPRFVSGLATAMMSWVFIRLKEDKSLITSRARKAGKQTNIQKHNLNNVSNKEIKILLT